MKYLPLFAFVMLLSAACNKEQRMSDSAIDAKIDSIVGSRMEEINRRAMEDRDQRMTIEVKAKADSILAAWSKTGAGDTATITQQPIP